MIIPTFDGKHIDMPIDDKGVGEHLLALPAVIDPHVHFRTPGLTHKEDWLTGAKVALRGGCTTVFDMPNTLPPTVTAECVREKKDIIDAQLKAVDIPLRYQLFFGADKNHLTEINTVKTKCVGIKVFMGCSTGNLVIDDDESLHAVFEMAAKENMIVAVHAEDEHLIRERSKAFVDVTSFAVHSDIRNIEVATRAVAKAIALTKKYGTKLYILHVSSSDEVALIKAAKSEKLPVYAETTPHHLFFNDGLYATLGGRAQVNPPLRSKEHQGALFAAIQDKIIDTIGSDHAPHTQAEKAQSYGQCPSGMPGLEFMLPMLLNAYHQQLLSIEEIVSLTSKRAREIFNVPPNDDYVIVDLKKEALVNHTYSKCAYTPYQGLKLTGWPVYTQLRGRVYDVNKL